MKNNINEAKRHHYIPQFIIKNFTNNDLGFVNYYDKKREKLLRMPTEEIFKRNDLYRDEINNPNDPVKIEKDFSKYELEISKIINKKILKSDEVFLTKEENDSLILFLALLHYRSQNWFNIMKNNNDNGSDSILGPYNKDNDFVNMWRRNLGHLVNCRSIREVLDHRDIDDPFKAFLGMDTLGLIGRYLVIADRRGEEDFILSDAYPLYINGERDDGISFPLMTVFPISPDRIIISAVRGIKLTPQHVRIFDKSFFSEPYFLNNKKSYYFKIRKMYKKEIEIINDGIYNQAKEGFAFINEDRFLVIDRNN